MKPSTGPTGRLIEGHVLDCRKGPIERSLKAYDPLLYVRWNPKKLRRWGCWEIRRRPENKTAKDADMVVYNGHTIVFPKYHEIDHINHVLDVPFLNYQVLDQIKAMDTWVHYNGGKDFAKAGEYAEAKYLEKMEDKAEQDKAYAVRDNKTQISQFKEYILSGGNPHLIAQYWDKLGS